MSGAVLLLLLCVGVVSVSACTLIASSTTLVNGTNFQMSMINENLSAASQTPCVAWVNQNGVAYPRPELSVVANTIVTFQLNSTASVFPFGLTLLNSTATPTQGDALGLSYSGACILYPDSRVLNNTIAHDKTMTQPCTVTWTVPPANDTKQYYYFMGAFIDNPDSITISAPRRIYIVAADTPSSPSSSSSSTGPSSTGPSSSSGSGSGSPTNSTGTTDSTTTTAPPTGTPTPTGNTPTPTGTPTPTTTGAPTTPTPTKGPNSDASVTRASVVIAVVCAMLAVFGL